MDESENINAEETKEESPIEENSEIESKEESPVQPTEEATEGKKEIIEDIEKSGVSEEVAEKEEALDEKAQAQEVQENSKPNKIETSQIVPENMQATESPTSLKKSELFSAKEGKIRCFLKGKNKKPSWKPMIFVMIVSLFIVFFWENIPIIKESVHVILDPSAGALLQLNIPYGIEIGMLIITLLISLMTTLAQKYCTDQATLKELRKEQKILQKKSQEFKHEPEKMMEIQKEIMPLTMKTMKLSTRAMAFTGIPFLLFFRWFHDFFTGMGDPKFFGVLSWLWFYFIAVIVFSSILRKLLKVV